MSVTKESLSLKKMGRLPFVKKIQIVFHLEQNCGRLPFLGKSEKMVMDGKKK